MRFSARAAVAALCVATTFTAIPAHAQSSHSSSTTNSGTETSSAGDVFKSLFFDLTEALVNSPGSSDRSFAATTQATEQMGSSKLRLDTVYKDQDDYFPMAVDANITEAKLISRAPEDTARYSDVPFTLERWIVSSPSMKRNIEVQVKLPENPEQPAPMLYMLDGLSAPSTSGWLRNGKLVETLQGENVTVVMPTQAGGTIYADWSQYDQKLGVQKWETFLSAELPSVMESESAALNWNGKKAIGGLSMGAAGAIRNAAFHPQQWDAAFGISGCYSTMDGASRTLNRMIVEPRGGSLNNAWGAYGSEEWLRHDLTRNREALRNLKDVRVYLSSSDGNITAADRAHAMENMDFYELPLWATIEQGMRHCTKRLDAAMEQEGVTNKVVRYTSGRIHDWPLYRDELPHAWAAIKPALY